MKITTIRLLILGALTLVAFSSSWAEGPPGQPGGPPPPPPRAIPAITAPDMFPNGCVDCHVHRADLGLDVRLSTLMKQWCEGAPPKLATAAQASAPAGVKLAGKHPEVAEALADVPRRCLECHGADAQDAPPFGRLMHRVHLTGGEENHFLTMFQGECTHCHKLDVVTGAWRLSSGPEK